MFVLQWDYSPLTGGRALRTFVVAPADRLESFFFFMWGFLEHNAFGQSTFPIKLIVLLS